MGTPRFTGTALDRASSERKDPEWVASRLACPASRAVLVTRDGVVVEDGEESLARVPAASGWPGAVSGAVSGAGRSAAAAPVLLGVDGDNALFAVDLDALEPDTAERLVADRRVLPLRDAGTALHHSEGGLAAYAVALLNWHRRHRFCANCGAATDVIDGGYARRCPRCRREHFPRTDPVVIMVVEHDRRLLLGRRAGWPTHRYSALAGFVSPGESVEEAVVREVWEESGIVAREPRFVASQPWPFPSSLMLGFEAQSPGGEPVTRDGELEDVRWFTPEEVNAAVAGASAEVLLPPPVSIARFLIERWAARRARSDSPGGTA